MAASSPSQVQCSDCDDLDFDAAANVFRHLSSRHNHPVESHDLLCVLRVGGRLHEAVRNAVTQVCTRQADQEELFFVVPFSNLREVLQGIGDKLKDLCIEDSLPGQEMQDCFPWLRVLASNRAMLRKLDISLVADVPLEEVVLSAVHCRVASISVFGNHRQQIPTPFSGLRELHLGNLEVNAFDMWRALGPTLEALSVREMAAEVYKDTLGHIQTFCRKLTSMEIAFIKDRWQPHADFSCLTEFNFSMCCFWIGMEVLLMRNLKKSLRFVPMFAAMVPAQRWILFLCQQWPDA